MDIQLNIPTEIVDTKTFTKWLNNFASSIELEEDWETEELGETTRFTGKLLNPDIKDMAASFETLLQLFPTIEIKGSCYMNGEEIEFDFGSEIQGTMSEQVVEYFYNEKGEDMEGLIETRVNISNGKVYERKTSIRIQEEENY
jgi:hypothetical protein